MWYNSQVMAENVHDLLPGSDEHEESARDNEIGGIPDPSDLNRIKAIHEATARATALGAKAEFISDPDSRLTAYVLRTVPHEAGDQTAGEPIPGESATGAPEGTSEWFEEQRALLATFEPREKTRSFKRPAPRLATPKEARMFDAQRRSLKERNKRQRYQKTG